MPNKHLIITLMLLLTVVVGCSSSGGSDVIIPQDGLSNASAINSRQLWGLWQFTADPSTQTLDVIPIRDAAMHLNAMHFLEPPANLYLSVENIKFNGKIIDADVSLRHPFLGMKIYTGFDVTGILISNGSKSGFNDPDLRMPDKGDTRLLNPDGYTRWWNPSEFPVNNGTMFSYQDGLFGQPYSSAGFNATLNACKFFCDDLKNPNDPLTKITVEGRAMFSAGQKNTRHYTIEMGDDGLVFNYAVDANWKYPSGTPPYQVPDDFEPAANRPEAYRISVTELENTLYNDFVSWGGDLSLAIDVYDHFNADKNVVRVEAPWEVPAMSSVTIIGGGAGYSTYQVDINDCTPAAAGDLELLITIESDTSGYGGILPDKPVCAYFTHTTAVSSEHHGPWSKEFVATDSSSRFPVIAQTTSGRIIGAWSTDYGVGWNEFTMPDTWGEPSTVDTGIDAIRMSIAPGIAGDDIVVTTQNYTGTMTIAGEQAEYGHPLVYKWDGASYWDKWDTNLILSQLMVHSMIDFEGKYQWFWGTYDAYGHPVHCQFSTWKQTGFFDYGANYYQGYSNIAEIGYSRCWDEDPDGNLFIAYEFDYNKNPYQPPQNKRGIFIAAQYLPSMTSNAATFLVEQNSYPTCDGPTLAIDSNGKFHLAYRQHTFTEYWQVVYRWSDDGQNWPAENKTVVWNEPGGEPVRRYISIDADSMNRIHLTFMAGGLIYYMRSSDGVNWLPLEIVNESIIDIVGVGDHQPWMFVDADNQVHVVWARLVVYPGTEFGAIRHRWRNALP